jgi:hypothetical protein
MLSGDMRERVRLFRTYQTKVVPGLLQTAACMTVVLTAVRHERPPDFIGGDPGSNASECPAGFVIPQTGDFAFRGKTVTDPALITELNQHIGKAGDESGVWLPTRMAPLIRDAPGRARAGAARPRP